MGYSRKNKRGAGEKVDGNQSQIVSELRQAGFSVATGYDDIIVGRAGITLWCEIKNPAVRHTIEESQKELDKWFRGARIYVFETEDVLEWFKEKMRARG